MVHSDWAALSLQGMRDYLPLTSSKIGYYKRECKHGEKVVQREKLEPENKEPEAGTLGTPTPEGKGKETRRQKVLWAKMCLPPNLDVDASEWDPIWRKALKRLLG